jgi:hypothetical protein
MAAPTASTSTHIPRAVSRYFRLDWNYAVQVVRIPTLRWAAQIIVSAPILAQFTSLFNFHNSQVILIWVAALLFVIGYVVLLLRMPLFLRENPSFKVFLERGNAHRWVLWAFQQNFGAFVDPANVISETIDKGLSFRANDASAGLKAYAVSPIFAAPTDKNLVLLKPVNLNNDLYLPFYRDGQRYVLPIQQCDPNLDKREKELFWVTYTALASTRPIWRGIVWLMFALSAVCFAIALVVIIYHILTAAPDRTPYYV